MIRQNLKVGKGVFPLNYVLHKTVYFGCWSPFSEWWNVDILVLRLVEILVQTLSGRARSGDWAVSRPRSATSWWGTEGTMISWARNRLSVFTGGVGLAVRVAVSPCVNFTNRVIQDGYLMQGLLWRVVLSPRSSTAKCLTRRQHAVARHMPAAMACCSVHKWQVQECCHAFHERVALCELEQAFGCAKGGL